MQPHSLNRTVGEGRDSFWRGVAASTCPAILLATCQFGVFVLIVAGLGLALLGCSAAPSKTGKAAAAPAPTADFDPSSLQLVGDLTKVWGMQSQRVDGVSLIVGLSGTGSDPPPTVEREMLLAEMQRQEVDKPNSVLASNSTALVHVKGVIPPGAKKGDRFDIEVRSPKDSETVNLAGGWMMECRLREYAAINGRVAEGHILAIAQGDVLTQALLEQSIDDVNKVRGVVLGGGVVLKPRGFGLLVRDSYTSVKTSSRLGEAINARFNVYHKGQKRGVANPKRDNYVELVVHPAYQDNVVRYMRVVQNIAVRESGKQRSARLQELRQQLAQPSTAALAAIQLEAIGLDALPMLREAVVSGNQEIRFYAGEALAYLNDPEAIAALGEAVRHEPAFRYRALVALGAMDEPSAADELVDLMNEASAETRYGAFRTLRKRSPYDPMIGGQRLDDKFHLHEVNSAGPPLIHVARHERPEIVLFGTDHHFIEPVVLFAGKDLVIRSAEPGRVTVCRLMAGDEDQNMKVPNRVADVIKAMVHFGGSYADVVQSLSEARRLGLLSSRLEYSAIPETGRTYLPDGQRPQRRGVESDREVHSEGDELLPLDMDQGWEQLFQPDPEVLDSDVNFEGDWGERDELDLRAGASSSAVRAATAEHLLRQLPAPMQLTVTPTVDDSEPSSALDFTDQQTRHGGSQSNALQTASLVPLPAAIPIIVASSPIAEVVIEHGQSHHDHRDPHLALDSLAIFPEPSTMVTTLDANATQYLTQESRSRQLQDPFAPDPEKVLQGTDLLELITRAPISRHRR